MEIVWVLLLTVCSHTGCISQEVLQEKNEQDCHYQRLVHDTLPSDGDWVSITWECKPKNSFEA